MGFLASAVLPAEAYLVSFVPRITNKHKTVVTISSIATAVS